MYSVYLLTGSNLGDRKKQLQQAFQALEQQVGIIKSSSKIYETAAWGIEGLPSHLNQAIHIFTLLEPLQLLETIHNIEHKLGRIRQEKWGIRAIDIDIIYFENDVINFPNLVVPHPLMQSRNFALVPLAEIAPDFVHPVLHKTNAELLKQSQDTLSATPL